MDEYPISNIQYPTSNIEQMTEDGPSFVYATPRQAEDGFATLPPSHKLPTSS